MVSDRRESTGSVIAPHNLEAERAILGAILFERDVIAIVAGRLTPGDFYVDAHGRIFDAARRLHTAGHAVDSITVRQALADAEELDAVGGPAALAMLMDEASIAAYLDEYVEIVRELAIKRRLRDFGSRLVDAASNGAGSAALLAEMASLATSLDTPLRAPDLTREGPDLSLVWPGDMRMTLTAVRIGRDGVKGELSVYHGRRRLHWGAINLANVSGREQLVKKLREVLPSVPWREHLEDACARFTAAAREGEPLVRLTGAAAARPMILVPRLLRAGETTVVYADGGSGKSLFTLAIAALVAHGPECSLPGGLRAMRQTPVAVLDWEGSRDSQEERFGPLCAGLGIDPPEILYRPMTHALADDAAVLAADFARKGVGLVVADSLAPACGPEPEGADAVVRTMNALQMFSPAARLVVAHVTKAEADRRGGARPFGSVFVWNLARCLWELRRDEEDTEGLTVALVNRKVNSGPKHPPFGLRFVFGADTITPYPVDLGSTPSLTGGVSLAYRVRLALAQGRIRPDVLAEQLAAKEETVTRTLRRLRKEGKARECADGAWEHVA